MSLALDTSSSCEAPVFRAQSGAGSFEAYAVGILSASGLSGKLTCMGWDHIGQLAMASNRGNFASAHAELTDDSLMSAAHSLSAARLA